MKTILVATDFSDAAHNAAQYGIALAKAFNARLLLFNTYQPIPVVFDVAPVSTPWEELNEMTLGNLKAEESAINPDHKVTVLTGFDEAVVTEEAILQAAADARADLIIVGMKNRNREMRKLFGSTVIALAQKTTIPLIVVPEKTNYQPIHTVALANESDLADDADWNQLNSIREIAAHFRSRLYLVRVIEHRHAATELPRKPVLLSQALMALNPLYKCVEGHNVTYGLHEFINSHNVQLLAVMPHKLSLFERWFVGSITRHLIFDITVPILVLPNIA